MPRINQLHHQPDHRWNSANADCRMHRRLGVVDLVGRPDLQEALEVIRFVQNNQLCSKTFSNDYCFGKRLFRYIEFVSA